MSGDFEPPSAVDEQAGIDWRPNENDHASRDELDRVIARVTPDLMQIVGVHGVGRGLHEAGRVAIVVHIDDDSVRDRLPASLHGYPVLAVVVRGGFGIVW